jgi:hypothetical protein
MGTYVLHEHTFPCQVGKYPFEGGRPVLAHLLLLALASKFARHQLIDGHLILRHHRRQDFIHRQLFTARLKLLDDVLSLFGLQERFGLAEDDLDAFAPRITPSRTSGFRAT